MTQRVDPLWSELFPFRLTFDDDLRFVGFGPAIAKSLPHLKVGDRLLECFELKRPRGALTRETLEQSGRRLFVLWERSRDVSMRGQMVRDAARGVYHFFGSPWVTHTDDLKRIGLTARDYAPHDGTLDYLFALNLKMASLAQLGTTYKELHRQQQELQEVHARIASVQAHMKSIFQSMTDALVVVGPDGTIKSLNTATSKLLGYSVEELEQKPIGILFAEAEALVSTKLAELIEKGAIQNKDMAFRAKDGLVIPTLVNGSAMRDDAGKLTGIVLVARDVREMRKLLEESNAAADVERHKSEELRAKQDELQRFLAVTVGRELDMIELKQEINDLLKVQGRPEKYQVTNRTAWLQYRLRKPTG